MNVLLADPDKSFINGVLDYWKLQDVILTTVTEVEALLSIVQEEDYGLVYLSSDFLVLRDLDAISFIKEHQPGIEIIVLCDGKTIQAAENALQRGATSYLLKPLDYSVLENSARKSRTRVENRKNYRLMEDHVLEDLLGNTPAMKKILRLLYKVAPTTSTILITGESGTGKEFVANIIHRLSKRSDEPFVTVNCGAIPENIVESELFGAQKGAFTGAVSKKGLFEEADQGTLFLDEVAELHPQTQVKLLRFLQDKEIRRLGSTESRQLDVRIIAATNRVVAKEVQEERFREDLYYRLNTFQIHLPPLRERKETIPNLVRFFILKYQQEHEKVISKLDPAAQIALTRYNYPGNVRELEHIIEHAVVLSENEEIRLEDLPESLHNPDNNPNLKALLAPNAQEPISLHTTTHAADSLPQDSMIKTLAEVEREHIMQVLNALDNNQSETAKRLGIGRSTLWRKLQEHKIDL